MATALEDDTRGISESAGVAILVGITILVTASVGLNVLVVGEEDTGPPTANFTYEYVDTSNALLVTYPREDELKAGKLYFSGADQEKTWATLAKTNETATVEPGDIVQLSERNPFGKRITTSTRIEIRYEYRGNRTKIDEWPTKS